MKFVYVLLEKHVPVSEAGYVAPLVFATKDSLTNYVEATYEVHGRWKFKLIHGYEVRTDDGMYDLVAFEKEVQK